MKKIIILSIFIAFSSCKKEKSNNSSSYAPPSIIYPGSYFPCYPNSWWEYQIIDYNNNTTLQLSSVGSNYEPHSFITNESGDFSDTALVPFLNGNPIYGYQKLDYVAPPFGSYYTLWPILNENVGHTFKRSWTDGRFGDFNEYLEVTSKYFDGTDSLIILEGHWVWGPKMNHRSYQVYKKDIGLTNHYEIDNSTGDTIYKKILINYFVDM